MTDVTLPSAERFTVLVLAADRGADDPVARAGGVACKSLVLVAGIPMLERVVAALAASPWVGNIAVSLRDTNILTEFRGLDQAVNDGRVIAVQAQNSPSRSVLHAVEQLGHSYPLLITTSDHALLTAEMVDYFCSQSAQSGADVCAGLTSAQVILARYPDSVRTYLKFRGGMYSGSNLFSLLTAQGIKGPETWRQAEQHRKQPWKIARVFGMGVLTAYLLRRLTLETAFARIGAKVGIKLAPITMPFAEAAIDVDSPGDLQMVEDILRRTD
ncbi:MAG: nucleotidyltransferase family protein [Proteobacteria bacterium]|nr:nucleotidyltransferase family protein [Pseudomonadota bacterium]